jgi:hypothetical protein
LKSQAVIKRRFNHTKQKFNKLEDRSFKFTNFRRKMKKIIKAKAKGLTIRAKGIYETQSSTPIYTYGNPKRGRYIESCPELKLKTY